MGKKYLHTMLLAFSLIVTTGNGFCQSIGDFQSHQTGPWLTTSTWERWDGTTWVTPAPSTPTASSGIITILNGHKVTSSNSITLDQVVIENGGTWQHTSSSITVANGAGDDVLIKYGGRFISTVSSVPVFNAGCIFRIQKGAVLEGAHSTVATNYAADASGSVIWEDSSIYENTGGGATLKFYTATYFPLVAANVIPIFKLISYSSLSSTGGNGIINGLFECNTGATFNDGATMTFRNGIRGTGTISQTASAGQFIITGDSAELGGSGLISLGTNGLRIATGAQVYMTSNKTINGLLAGNSSIVEGTLVCGTRVLAGSAAFTLSPGGTLKMGSTNGISNLPTASGNIQNTGATRSFSKGANYVYNGSAAQISGVGIPDSVRSLTIDNGAGLMLSNPSLTDTLLLTLSNGRIKTDAAHALILSATAAVSSGINVYGDVNEGNQSSFVNGPLIVERNNINLVTLPIGKDTSIGVYYAPVKLKPFNTISKSYTAEYFPSIHPNQSNIDAPLHHVSYVEFWDINCTAGSAPDRSATVGLSWRPQSFVGNGNPLDSTQAKADLVVAHYFHDGVSLKWRIEGSAGPTFTVRPNSNINYGYVTTNLNTGSFSPFTLGSRSNLDLLPVKLLSFSGKKAAAGILLQWKTKEEQHVGKYELQFSRDGINFATISSINAYNGIGDNNYNFNHREINRGYNYYRLKIIDNNTSVHYSAIIRLQSDAWNLAVYPNPATATITVQHQKAEKGSNISIFAPDGKKIYSLNATIGSNTTSLNIDLLPKGIYLLQYITSTSNTKQSFIKQ